MTVKFTITRTDTIECGDLNCDDCQHLRYGKAGYGQTKRCAVYGHELESFYQGWLSRKWNYHRCSECRLAEKENTNG